VIPPVPMTIDAKTDKHTGPPLPLGEDDAIPDIDLTAKKPLRLGVALGDTVWLNDAVSDVIRVCAEDLRGVADQVGAARQEHPGCDVIVDIDVVIAGEAREARAAVAHAGALSDHGTLRYVGTATGLAGLVADMYALGLSDGAMLIPLIGDETSALIRDVVVPELATLLPDDPVEGQRSRPA
jgi:hypothetical protein